MSARVVFFGTPHFAVPSLEQLASSGMEVVAVVTAPDKPAGRKRILTSSPVKAVAERLGLTVLQPASLKDDAFFEEFSALAPDVCVIVAYGKIVPQRYLDVPEHGFVNVHPSLLPKWRGPSPIQATLRAGDSTTGLSIMVIDAEMDHGPLIVQRDLPLTGAEHMPELSERLATLGAELLVEAITTHLDGSVSPTPQDHVQATVCSMITRDEARIDWSQPATEIANMIRAFSGDPNSWTTWNGEVLNLIRTHGIATTTDAPPGTVVRDNEHIGVQAGDGVVIIEQLQLHGGKRLSTRDFINGHGDFVDSVLE